MTRSSSSSSSTSALRHDEETPLLRAAHDHAHAHDHDRYDSIASSSKLTTECEAEAEADAEAQLDEPGHDAKERETPLDWPQFSLVLFLQLAEPLTSQVIYPFVPQLIRELGVTGGDETKVGYYVGLMQSIFFATQGLTVLHWSRLSDTLGRKPVILTGLLGLALSMACFGLARTFAGLVLARSLNGALNGNIGVIKSVMGEMTDETNVARAFAWQPLPWSTGATIGPLIGGALSHPAERFPALFGNNEFLRAYPYFLPCAIPATFTLICWIITYLFLKETNPRNAPLAALLSHKLKLNRKGKSSPPGTPTKESPLLSLSPSAPRQRPAPPLLSLLTPRTLLASACYALLSLLDIAYRALQPVFYATPAALGGLGLAPHQIGAWLALLGAANGAFQVALFPRMCARWGVRGVFMVGIASAAPVFALFPAMSVCVALREDILSRPLPLPHSNSGSVLLAPLVTLLPPLLLAAQLALTLLLNACYSACFIYITASAPRRALGAVNGLAQTTVSLMRCVGPAVASALFSACLRWRYVERRGVAWGWSVYGLMIGLVGVTLVVGGRLPEKPWRREEVEAEAEAEAEEAEGI